MSPLHSNCRSHWRNGCGLPVLFTFACSTPGYLFGKRMLFFLMLMSVLGIVNYLVARYCGSDYNKDMLETLTKAASALLLIP